MHTITIENMLHVQAELIRCLFNANGFGGNTAEIYCYRLTQQSPMYQMPGARTLMSESDSIQQDIDARNNLAFIIESVQREFDVKLVEIDGLTYKQWLRETKTHGIAHRVHVRMSLKKASN